MKDITNESQFLFYHGRDGKNHVQVIVGENTVWTTQSGMAEIFGIDRTGVNKHIQNIYKTQELNEAATCAKIAQVQNEGDRTVTREMDFFSLDMIISVGYRVNSYKATQFRIWATRILNEYLIKGFVLDDERLKQGNKLFGKDHFKELLERIREIRASERMFYEKITDLYATSEDYDKNSPVTHKFFSKVQNKLEFAITGQTSAEIIKSRADCSMPFMGLKTYKNAGKAGKVQKSDVTVAKNYLAEDELKKLNTLVNMYLDYAELQAERNRIMKIEDWSNKLDAFLNFNEYDVLTNAGSVSRDSADNFAESEYSKYRVIQDKEYKSDFNKFIEQVKSNSLPVESFVGDSESAGRPELSEFNKSLETALNYNPKQK